MKKIYLVEDEKELSDLLVSYLENAGYELTTFNDGLKAKEAINDKPDIWVLDIMLPGMNGYALIKEIKMATPEIPVIFMSARSEELDRVIGLEMGSDDYLPKPFLPRELILRVERLIKSEKKKIGELRVALGNSIFDRERRIVLTEEDEIILTVKEFDLLEALIQNKGKAVSRTDIIDTVWGENYFGSERVVDDTLRRLRKKIPDLPLETVYGFGYLLKVD